jgi:hypothetical protein
MSTTYTKDRICSHLDHQRKIEIEKRSTRRQKKRKRKRKRGIENEKKRTNEGGIGKRNDWNTKKENGRKGRGECDTRM